ncbi:hypothetical protein FACS18949_09960 [Clostridia bacterium]|nr:hypothetical protein FACS18949_09960 [Clostridia bacterium]
MEIVKVYTEALPASRLIGLRYVDADRLNGSFGHKWGEWFHNGRFAELEKLGSLPENGDAYVGAMRVADGVFEYWIGMFFPKDTPPLQGFEYADVPALNYATFWLYGDEKSGELFGMDAHERCLDEIKRRGWARKDDDWCMERYNCPRFTTPDDKGNVILDYCVSVEL